MTTIYTAGGATREEALAELDQRKEEDGLPLLQILSNVEVTEHPILWGIDKGSIVLSQEVDINETYSPRLY